MVKFLPHSAAKVQQHMIIPQSLLLHGVPHEKIQVLTPTGMTIWYPDGEVRAPRTHDKWDNLNKPVLFVNLTLR